MGLYEIKAPPAKPGYKIVYFQHDVPELVTRSYLRAVYVPESQIGSKHLEGDLLAGAYEDAKWVDPFLGATDGMLPSSVAKEMDHKIVLGADLFVAVKNAKRGEWGAAI